jgi:hypothetical protein
VYTLTIEALPSDVPAALRLRGVLKRLLRTFAFRAVEVAEVPAGGEAGGGQEPTGDRRGGGGE